MHFPGPKALQKSKLMKNLQLRLFLIIGFFAIITSYNQSAAQTSMPYFSVSGKLMDSVSKKPAGWATINIIGSANTIVKTGISDSTGIFTLSQIPSGTYKLEIV